MDALQETEKLLSQMTRAEKAQVLHWVVRDLVKPFLVLKASWVFPVGSLASFAPVSRFGYL